MPPESRPLHCRLGPDPLSPDDRLYAALAARGDRTLVDFIWLAIFGRTRWSPSLTDEEFAERLEAIARLDA